MKRIFKSKKKNNNKPIILKKFLNFKDFKWTRKKKGALPQKFPSNNAQDERLF